MKIRKPDSTYFFFMQYRRSLNTYQAFSSIKVQNRQIFSYVVRHNSLVFQIEEQFFWGDSEGRTDVGYRRADFRLLGGACLGYQISGYLGFY